MLKIANKYIKLYEASIHDNSIAWIWESIEAYIEEQKNVYTKYLKNNESGFDVKIQVYLSLIKNPYLLGLYESFKKEDWKLLNDTLYQYGRHRMLDINADGYDQSGEFWEVMDCMACNDIEALEKAYPEELGLSSNGYPAFVVASNLLFVLWYHKDEYAEEVISKAKKMLQQKKSLWEKAIVSFLIALYDKNMQEASIQLNQVCVASRRNDRPKLYKYFCSEAHGLYNIARNILPEELFEQLEMPKDESFIKELAIWQKKAGYPNGEFFIDYPEELDFMNHILKLPLPKCCLCSPYSNSKKKYRDHEHMKKELADFKDEQIQI
jgi:hypothetical protein